MKRKKRGYTPKNFEAYGGRIPTTNGHSIYDTFCMIFESMLRSEAFISLTPKQRILYVYLKAQYYGKRKPSNDFSDIPKFNNKDLFYFNWGIAKQYHLYPDGCSSNFYKDIKALIEKGFIEKVSSGKSTHKKNIYKYSTNWKQYKS